MIARIGGLEFCDDSPRMNKLPFVFSVYVLLAVVGLAADSRPNILLILSDDHSMPHLGVYGDANCKRFNITPNLDAMASEGMLFNRTYTAAPQCAPSRISIFAGRSPVGLSTTRFAQPARADTVLFTDVLREGGYWVGLDGRHQHLDGRGKDLDHVTEALVELGMRDEAFEKRFDHFVRGASTKGGELPKVGELVGSILDEVPDGKPFFLYFGFNQPHRRWGDDYEKIDPSQLVLPPDWPDLPEVRLDYAKYLAEVRDLDTGIGLIDSVFEKRGLKDSTLVIFMGDNGEALLRGKGTLMTRGTHVPMMVRWPGKVKAGSISDALVSGVDLAATVLEVAGLETAPVMTGVSFLDELRGERFEGRDHLFSERGWHFGPITQTDGFDLSRSITTRRYHYIYNAIPERRYSPVDMGKKSVWLAMQALNKQGELSPLHERLYFHLPRPIFELYDLKSDPFQLENLAGGKPTKAIETKLRVEMDKWMIRESDFLPLPSHVQQLENR